MDFKTKKSDSPTLNCEAVLQKATGLLIADAIGGGLAATPAQGFGDQAAAVMRCNC